MTLRTKIILGVSVLAVFSAMWFGETQSQDKTTVIADPPPNPCINKSSRDYDCIRYDGLKNN
jgi:hypothetical protein